MSNPTQTRSASEQEKRAAAIENLLVNCARIVPGQNVLLLNEIGSGLVDASAVEAIGARATALGAAVRSLWTARVESREEIAPEIFEAIERSDVTIFNHNIGGKLRFHPLPAAKVGVQNYASSEAILGSEWARVPYGLWERVSALIAAELSRGERWRITCTRGTDLAGAFIEDEVASPASSDGFTLRTFPLGTHRPISAASANGTLAIRWLVSSGNRFDGAIKLENWIFARVEAGRITEFGGPLSEAKRAKRYLDYVATLTGQDPWVVSSWHAGVNPQATTAWNDISNLNRWVSLTHGNPRTLHLHVVGARTPGELSLPIIDQTVAVDGEVLWERGRFAFLERPSVRQVAEEWLDDGTAFRLNSAVGV